MWIKDKTVKPQPNSLVVIAVRVDSESVDYHTAVFDICASCKDEFVLAHDDIDQLFKLDEVEAWQVLEKI